MASGEDSVWGEQWDSLDLLTRSKAHGRRSLCLFWFCVLGLLCLFICVCACVWLCVLALACVRDCVRVGVFISKSLTSILILHIYAVLPNSLIFTLYCSFTLIAPCHLPWHGLTDPTPTGSLASPQSVDRHHALTADRGNVRVLFDSFMGDTQSSSVHGVRYSFSFKRIPI